MKKLIFVILFLIACNPEQRKEFFPSVKEQADQLTYVKDHRTNLCFVWNPVYTSGMTSDTFVNVPCIPEVEKLIK